MTTELFGNTYTSTPKLYTPVVQKLTRIRGGEGDGKERRYMREGRGEERRGEGRGERNTQN